MIVGVTGTQRGATDAQLATLKLMLSPDSITEFHHGDCIGVDAQAHEIFRDIWQYGLVVIHPPDNPSKRAFCGQADGYTIMRPEKPYLVRNRDIAVVSDLLIGVPGENEEQLRSGTWATLRYAHKAGKLVLVILPDGTLLPFQPRE